MPNEQEANMKPDINSGCFVERHCVHGGSHRLVIVIKDNEFCASLSMSDVRMKVARLVSASKWYKPWTWFTYKTYKTELK